MADAVECGQLEVILPEWKVPDKDLFLVYPSGEHHSPRAFALVHALLKRLEATKDAKLVTSAKQFIS